MKIKSTLLALIVILLISCKNSKKEEQQKSIEREEIVTIFEGIAPGRNGENLVLKKSTDDMWNDIADTIPIIDGKFRHKIITKNIIPYHITFEKELRETSSYIPIVLFSEGGKVELELNSATEPDKNVIKGSAINNEYQDYKKNVENRHWKTVDELYAQYGGHNTDSIYTDEAIALQEKIKIVIKTDKEEYLRLVKIRKKMQADGSFYSAYGKERNSKIDDLMKSFLQKKDT